MKPNALTQAFEAEDFSGGPATSTPPKLRVLRRPMGEPQFRRLRRGVAMAMKLKVLIQAIEAEFVSGDLVVDSLDKTGRSSAPLAALGPGDRGATSRRP